MSGFTPPLYKGTVTARNGTLVPVFADGRTLYSCYNPEQDASTFAARAQSADGCGFFVVGGIGSGLHLDALKKLYPDSVVLAVEPDDATLGFLEESGMFRQVAGGAENSIITCTFGTLHREILCQYKPAVHGNFSFLAVRSWSDAIGGEAFGTLQTAIRDALEEVSRDYAVQAHFGKLWHRNIFENLHAISQSRALQAKSTDAAARCRSLLAGKRAVIAAAGPTLDTHLAAPDSKGSKSSEGAALIATDTALPALLKRGVVPHIVVTIDAQEASAKHFLGLTGLLSLCRAEERPLLLADLTASPSAIRAARESGFPLLFFANNHPLAQWVQEYLRGENGAPHPFLEVSSGGGTVTHAAWEIAHAFGARNVEFWGADFAYTGNKPYGRGTYLEAQYSAAATRLGTLEHKYTALMYRTPLAGNTTQVLLAYRRALETRMESAKNEPPPQLQNACGAYTLTTNGYRCLVEDFCAAVAQGEKNAKIATLPLIAALKSEQKNSDTFYREILRLSRLFL